MRPSGVRVANTPAAAAPSSSRTRTWSRAGGKLLVIVPDIISILDAETAVPITNETLRYGQRVRVMAVGVPEIMRSEAALRQFGPAAFGLQDTYSPLSASAE